MDASKSAALRLLRILLITLTLNMVLLWQPASAQDAGLSEAGWAIANAINQVRVENGLEPLAVHPLLNQAAQGHVDDMLSNYIYGHYGSDGSTVQVRVARTGYSDTPWVSENWVSSGSPAGAMRWWMNDYIHRVNILTPRWREVGIGVGIRGSEMIFVTDFSAGEGAIGQAVNLDVPVDPPSVHIERESVPAEGLDYTIRAGDTLLAIGLRYGMPWEDLASANGLNETSLLQIGQVLRIPGSGEGAEAVAPVPDVPTQPYIVQAGDTLFTIAAKRGMSWQELAALNQLGERSILQIDQEIKVPADEPAEEPLLVESTAVEAPQGEIVAADQADTLANDASEEAPLDDRAAALAAIPVTAPGEVAVDTTPDVETPVLAQADVESAPADDGAAAVVLVEGTVVDNPVLTQDSQDRVVSDAAPVEVAAIASVAAAPADEAPLAEVSAAVSVGIGGPVAEGGTVGNALYVIAEGDTIFSVAVAQGLDWQQLMNLNDLTEYSILQPGQLIRLR